MIDLNLIHTFLIVAKTDNLREAGQQLGITQSAVSQRIGILEAQIGKRLFLRHGGLTLTSMGRAFMKVCAGFHENTTHIENWVLSESGVLGGPVRIITTHGMAGQLFSTFLAGFLDRYPKAQISCESTETSPQIEEQILTGKADLGVLVGLPKTPTLKAIKLMVNNNILMVCAPQHPLAHQKNISKENILATRLLVHAHTSARTQKQTFKMLGLHQNDIPKTIRLPDMLSCKQHALSGIGVAFVANIYVYDEIKKGLLVALPGFKLNAPLYLVSRNEKYEFPIVNTFKREFVLHCHKLVFSE